MSASAKTALDLIDQYRRTLEACEKELLKLTRHKSPEARLRALEALSDSRSRDVADHVRNALRDNHELVRVTAAEILGDWGDPNAGSVLTKLLSDRSQLVRSAAAMALARAQVREAEALIKSRLVDADEEEALTIHYALTTLGDLDHFWPFLCGLFSENYRVRCATANLLIDLVTDANRTFVRYFLGAALAAEKTRAARSSIEAALRKLPGVSRTSRGALVRKSAGSRL